MAMENQSRPHIICLTDAQAKRLQHFFKENRWKITVFKCIPPDLQCLVDLMIQNKQEELDLTSIQDNILHSARRHSKRKKIVNNELKVENGIKPTCMEEIPGNKGEKLQQEHINTQAENVHEDTKDNTVTVETFVEEAEEDNAKKDNSVKGGVEEVDEEIDEIELDGRDEGVKVKTRRTPRTSSYTVSKRHRKYIHKKVGDRVSVWTCEVCGKVAASEKYLQRHLEKLHSEQAKRRKEQEKRRKQDQDIYVCHICKKQFAHKYALMAHHTNMHGGKKDIYQCDLCGTIMKHKGSLVQHKKSVHSNQRPHKCDICGSEFKLYQQLKTHKRRHDPDFVETCTICGKTLKKGHIKTHMKRHTDDRKYKCDKCTKTFYEKQDLERHVILHSGEKPNKCPHCSYACAFKGNLTKHIKVRHETDLDLPELRAGSHEISVRSKYSSKGKLIESQNPNNKRPTSEHHSNTSTSIDSGSEAHLGRIDTDPLYLNRGLTVKPWTDGIDKHRVVDEKNVNINYQHAIDEVKSPSVHIFSDTDSQSESFTSDSQFHILRPVRHISEHLEHNLSSLGQDVGETNFIDFRETYLSKMSLNDAE